MWPDWAIFERSWCQSFLAKVAQIFRNIFGLLWKIHIWSEICGGYFWCFKATFYSNIWSHWFHTKFVIIFCKHLDLTFPRHFDARSIIRRKKMCEFLVENLLWNFVSATTFQQHFVTRIVCSKWEWSNPTPTLIFKAKFCFYAFSRLMMRGFRLRSKKRQFSVSETNELCTYLILDRGLKTLYLGRYPFYLPTYTS